MFERFTERARMVVVYAQEEGRTLRHGYIGTEHILLGLVREEEGLAARVLASLGVSLEGVRDQVVRIVGSGDAVASGQIPFTPRAKKILELALREAISLGHNYIGTEHLLLGLVREDDGVAVRILLDLGADPERIREELTRMLRAAPAERAAVVEQDRSRFDFSEDEVSGLLAALAALSSRITLEVRRHGDQAASFRVSLQLIAGEGILRELVALEGVGVSAVLDARNVVRLGHLESSSPGEQSEP
jgi:ATP-dependent Clp protease ATP-binding subunit ClpA